MPTWSTCPWPCRSCRSHQNTQIRTVASRVTSRATGMSCLPNPILAGFGHVSPKLLTWTADPSHASGHGSAWLWTRPEDSSDQREGRVWPGLAVDALPLSILVLRTDRSWRWPASFCSSSGTPTCRLTNKTQSSAQGRAISKESRRTRRFSSAADRDGALKHNQTEAIARRLDGPHDVSRWSSGPWPRSGSKPARDLTLLRQPFQPLSSLKGAEGSAG